jgi:hypothetical protein
MANLMLIIEARLEALHDDARDKMREAHRDRLIRQAEYWCGKCDAYRRAVNEVRAAIAKADNQT